MAFSFFKKINPSYMLYYSLSTGDESNDTSGFSKVDILNRMEQDRERVKFIF